MARSGDFDALLERATGPKKSPHLCWAAKLTGDAADFLQMLESVEDETPGKVNKSEVLRIFQDEWGVKVPRESVARHFRRECQCRPSE